jgi:hypothetical protein
MGEEDKTSKQTVWAANCKDMETQEDLRQDKKSELKLEQA